jgi:hypothetical protein
MERNDDVIELGAASTETRGGGVIFAEEVLKQDIPGLSNDA